MSHGHQQLQLFCDFPECPCLNLVSCHLCITSKAVRNLVTVLFHVHNTHTHKKKILEEAHLVAALFLEAKHGYRLLTKSRSRFILPFADSIISVSCPGGHRGDTYPELVVPNPNPSGQVE